MRIQSINQNNYQNRNVGFKQNGRSIIRFACENVCPEAARAAIDDAARFMQKEHKVPVDIAVITPPSRGQIEVNFIDPQKPYSEPIVQEFSAAYICDAITLSKMMAAGIDIDIY